MTAAISLKSSNRVEGILKEKQENFEDASRKLDNRKNNGVFSDMKSTVYA